MLGYELLEIYHTDCVIIPLFLIAGEDRADRGVLNTKVTSSKPLLSAASLFDNLYSPRPFPVIAVTYLMTSKITAIDTVIAFDLPSLLLNHKYLVRRNN